MKISLVSCLRRGLRATIEELNLRGLQKAAKWSSEQLIGMVEGNEEGEGGGSVFYENDEMESRPDGSTGELRGLTNREMDLVTVGQSLIVGGEYQRCWHLLRSTFMQGDRSFPPTCTLGSFLVSYSLYMTGEQLKGQQISEQQGLEEYTSAISTTSSSGAPQPAAEAGGAISSLNRSKDKDASTAGSSVFNPFLRDLHDELYPFFAKGQLQDPYLLYLLGVVERELRKQGFRARGEEHAPWHILLQSVRMNPFNWSCWLEIAAICISDQVPPPSFYSLVGDDGGGGGSFAMDLDADHTATPTSQRLAGFWFMYNHFLIYLYLEQQLGHQALPLIAGLAHVLPASQCLMNLKALAFYCLREYDSAEQEFETARACDPYCLDHIDTYSNILYVKEDKVQLSHLAHMLTKIGKYSPEVCCVVGNYYSLKGLHERAILYFQRALRLNPKFLSAWTLMGHEYVELRNTSSAVFCYRKAVDVSPFDFRAWYGLGQTYEMLHLYQNAIYYYRKATSLKPQDARMWCAIGSCLFRLGERAKAIAAYERAVETGDREGIANSELAKLYKEGGQMDRAADAYLAILEMSGGGKEKSQVETDALLFLSRHYQALGDLQQAENFAIPLVHVVGREGDEARLILRDLRANSGGGHGS